MILHFHFISAVHIWFISYIINTEFSLLYKSLVWPILEFAAPVWCPFLIKDTVSLKKSLKESVETSPRPKEGRNGLRETLCHCKMVTIGKTKIVFFSDRVNNLEFQDFFQLASKTTRSNDSYKQEPVIGSCYKLKCKAPSWNCYKCSFFFIIRGGKSSVF